ncbi:MAG: hypothetical protein RL685_2316 [Pseudomonadota bacterium]|jgi:uncharacterized membrane protein
MGASWRTLALDQRIWWLLGIGAAVLLSPGLGHEPLWLDEAYTYAMTQHAPREIVVLTAEDVHPPLYYLLAKLSCLLLGDTDAGLRAPSMLGVVGLVLLGKGPSAACSGSARR